MVPFPTKRLQQICLHVGTSLRAGLDLRASWEIEAQRLSGRHRAVMSAIVDQMIDGSSLYDSIEAEAPDCFPALMKEMIQVGEHTGKLAEVLLRLAEHYDHKLELKRIIINGIAWPLFELAFAIAVITALIGIFGLIGNVERGEEPPNLFGLRGASGVATFLTLVGLVIAPILGLMVAIRRAWLPLDPLMAFLSRVPMLGRAIRTMAISRICWTLAMAHNAGIDAVRTMTMALKSSQNLIYTNAGRRAEEALKQHQTFLEAFQAAGVFPHDLLAAVQTGELAGRLSETLEAFSVQYLEKARQQFKTLAFVMGIIVFLGVAALIVAAIFYMFFKFIMDPLNQALNF